MTRQLLTHSAFFEDLLLLVNAHDGALAAGLPIAAAALKDDMLNRLEAWIADRAGRISVEVAEQEQITATQRMAGEKAADVDTACGF